MSEEVGRRLAALVASRLQRLLAGMPSSDASPGRIVYVATLRVDAPSDATLEQMAEQVTAGIAGRLPKEFAS